MIVANRTISPCNASAQHVIICIKLLIILIPACADPDVLMGQARPEYDRQAMQGGSLHLWDAEGRHHKHCNVRAHYLFHVYRRLCILFAVFQSTILASKSCRTNLLIWRCHGLTVAYRPIRILIVHHVLVELGRRPESAHRTLAIQGDSYGTLSSSIQARNFWLCHWSQYQNAGMHRSKCQETSASLYTFWTVIQVIFYVYLFSFGRIILVSRPGMDRTIPEERCFWFEYQGVHSILLLRVF